MKIYWLCRKQYTVGDSFIGYKDDTPASVLLETMHDLDDDADDNMVRKTCTYVFI